MRQISFGRLDSFVCVFCCISCIARVFGPENYLRKAFGGGARSCVIGSWVWVGILRAADPSSICTRGHV